MSKTNKKYKTSIKESTTENIKSRYVLTNVVKSNKLTTKLLKSSNIVASDKTFMGYSENDYENVEKMCKNNDTNLFVKGKSTFSDNVNCQNNISVKTQIIAGYKENEIDDLNNDTNLHIKGDSELNGNLYVYQNIKSDKNINVENSLNIGFQNNVPDNTSKLNVNGNSEFVGDNIVYGTEYVKNNLIVNDKATFYNDIFLSNSIALKKEQMTNVKINNNIISIDHSQILINKIIESIMTNDTEENYSALKFYSKKNCNINSGITSISKQFIIDEKKYFSFILAFCVYSNYKILVVKPIIDTFVLLDTNENLINISNNNIFTMDKSSLKSEVEIKSKKTSDTIVDSSLELLKINQIGEIFKTTSEKTKEIITVKSDNSSDFISEESTNSDEIKLIDFNVDTVKKKSCEKISQKDSSSNNSKKNNHFDDPNTIFELNDKLTNLKNKKYNKNKSNTFNFDSDIDLNAFEIVK